MNISSLKVIYFTIFILLFEGLIFGGNALLQLSQTNTFTPPQATGIWIADIIFYFGALVFWFLSLTANIFSVFITALFLIPNDLIKVFNGVLAIFLLISFIYLIRGVSE
jgi:hypothetical protein